MSAFNLPPGVTMRIDLHHRIDHLKGDWHVWSCTATMPDGSQVDGSVQADGSGEGVATETFEADE